MRDTDEPHGFRGWIARNIGMTVFASGVAATMVIVALRGPQPPFVNPHVASPPCRWPVGCVQRKYFERGAIPHDCAVRRYYFGNGYAQGFPQRSKGGAEYYRVDADAIDISCSLFTTDDCRARSIVRGVFVAK